MQEERGRGPRVKDLKVFNITLLAKWKWRIGSKLKGLWKRLLNPNMMGEETLGKETIVTSLNGGRI